MDKAMTDPQQFLDILMGYLHIFVKITVKRHLHITHGHSHRLNLVIGASCNVQCGRSVFDQIKEISYFSSFLSH